MVLVMDRPRTATPSRPPDDIEIMQRYQQRAPVDVDAIARELGLSVYHDHSLPDGISGMIRRDRRSPAGFAITINGRHHPNRQRFTLAHEIAHYLLHRSLIENEVVDDALYRSQTLQEPYERQADRLAANLLLPAPLVNAVASVPGSTMHDLARRFGVSQAAMNWRLDELGIRL